MVDWRFAYASAVGSSHLESGTVCQDSSHCVVIPTAGGDVLVAAVSDGAGSAPHSHIGSRLACTTFEAEIRALLEELGGEIPLTREHIEAWLQDFQEQARRSAEELDATARDLACTFVGAVVAPSWSAFCQIGDGGIVIKRGPASRSPAQPEVTVGDPAEAAMPPFAVAFWPAQGEYANETYFATMDGAVEHLQFRVDEGQVRDLALFSDGMQRLVLRFDVREPHAPFFNHIFRPVYALDNRRGEAVELSRALETYLASPPVYERTDDDVSLVLASRHYEPLPVGAETPIVSAPESVGSSPAVTTDAVADATLAGAEPA